jgi:two-component system nitrogen regulation sensor histidine kinase NtrY
MRLRFAVSGHPPKAELKEQATGNNPATSQATNTSETKRPASEINNTDEATNSDTKTEAAAGE